MILGHKGQGGKRRQKHKGNSRTQRLKDKRKHLGIMAREQETTLDQMNKMVKGYTGEEGLNGKV